ncbi:MAG: PEP-CTERM sorting domain-containing protein [Phycisphaerae bacterium]
MFTGHSHSKAGRVGALAIVAMAALGVLLLPGSRALAGGVVENGYVISITGEIEGVGSGSWSIPVPLNWTFSDEHTWAPGGTTTVMAGEVPLFDISDVIVTLKADPSVDLTFSVKNRQTVPQTFTVNSAVVSFDPLVNNWAYATAGVTLTDSTTNGASIAGLQAGGKTYEAMYNGTTVFADLVSGFSVPSGTLTMTERKPPLPADAVLIPGAVSSISSQFKFTLSASDSASGTSSFVVGAVPEPATLVLLAVGAAAMGRVRRRR